MKFSVITAFLAIAATSLFQSALAQNAAEQATGFVGTYTNGSSKSRGVYAISLGASGLSAPPRLVAELENASFVAIHPSRPLLYAFLKSSKRHEVGWSCCVFHRRWRKTCQPISVQLLALPAMGQLTPQGDGWGCELHRRQLYSVSDFRRWLLGKAGSFIQHTGNSGVNAGGRKHRAFHQFQSGRTQAFVADLGKDQILLYDVDPSKGTMKPSKQAFLDLPPGGGPRHFCFHPGFEIAFSNLELTSQVALLRYDQQKRTLKLVKVLDTIPPQARKTGNSTAECLVHPSGKFLFVSNRGHNSIAVFAVDAKSGSFQLMGNTPSVGEIPRGFGLTDDGRWLVLGNQKTGNVVTMSIDQETGKLTQVGKPVSLDAAVNVRFYSRQ